MTSGCVVVTRVLRVPCIHGDIPFNNILHLGIELLEQECKHIIRKYGSTFYIGIAMVIFPYFGPMGKLKCQPSLSVSTQFDFYQYQSGEHVES